MKKLYLFALMGAILNASADAKSLVAYYSRSGNTRAVAEIIKTATDADIYEIKTADPAHYPAEYTPATEVAKSEIDNKNYPAIGALPNMAEYDTVYIGTPCWWGTMAGPVYTFVTTADLAGKTVIPFNTHEGSGAGTVHTDMENLTPKSSHKPGLAVRGSATSGAASDVDAWLKNIGVN